MPTKCIRLALLAIGTLAGMAGWAVLARYSSFANQNPRPTPTSPPSRSRSDAFDITGIRVNSGRLSDETLQAIATHVNLESLDLSYCELSQRQYEWLADLRALRVLLLRGTRIRDAGFARLARLQELKELDLKWADITDKSLPAIGAMMRLKKLSLDGTDLSDKGLSHLRSLQGLEELSLGWLEPLEELRQAKRDRISRRGVEHLASLKALRILELPIDGTDEELRAVSTIRGLERLTLHTLRVTEKGMGCLSALEEIRHLHVSVNTKPKGEQIAMLLKLPRLESLELWVVPVNDAWAAQLCSCPKLQRLHVSYPGRLTDAGVADICALKGLRDLHLWGVENLTDRGMEHLATLGELRELDIGRSAISDQGIAHIAKLSQLKKLSLNSKRIGDQGIRHLAELKDLEYLGIGDTSVTDACVQDLAKLRHLKNLWIGGTAISRAGEERLEKALPGCSVERKFGTVASMLGGGPFASADDDEPAVKSGTVVGILTAKGNAWVEMGEVTARGDAWIEVKVDGEKKPRRYVPNWVGVDGKSGDGWDREMVEAILDLKVGSRVRVEWKYELRPRVIKIEVLKAAEGADTPRKPY